jgi:endogenous inhibitor of DNA gyrase (YacG/DUF329 family)
VRTKHIVSCPHCGAQVEWTPAARYRPFCSERCKMTDLGAWATEKFRIPEEKNGVENLPDGDED